MARSHAAMLLRRFFIAGLALLAPLLAAAQPGPGTTVTTQQVRAELMAQAPEGVQPGKPVWVGLQITHQPHWHTYWKNAGDSGLPTELAWTENAPYVLRNRAVPRVRSTSTSCCAPPPPPPPSAGLGVRQARRYEPRTRAPAVSTA